MPYNIIHLLLYSCCLLPLSCGYGYAQQVADEQFHYAISDPAYPVGNGSVLLFDESHHNGSTLRGTYAAFGKLLRDDGYQISSSDGPIDSNRLKQIDIYITVNAMYDPEDWNLPARSAFSQAEIRALTHWISQGGSLFLVTDHMPCGAAVQELAAAFDINVINGFALRKDGLAELFSRRKKTLLPNEITDWPGARIDSIHCWGGTGFIVPAAAQVISRLDDSYSIFLPTDVSQIKRPVPATVPSLSGRGIVNGAYLRFGRGRIVIFGDGAPFSAQLQGIKSKKRGMNHPSASQNAQFLRNIIHWLDPNRPADRY